MATPNPWDEYRRRRNLAWFAFIDVCTSLLHRRNAFDACVLWLQQLSLDSESAGRTLSCYCSFAYSALASFRMATSGSASCPCNRQASLAYALTVMSGRSTMTLKDGDSKWFPVGIYSLGSSPQVPDTTL